MTQGAFQQIWDFTESRGLPPKPVASDVSVGELRALVADSHPELAALLAQRYPKDETRARVIGSFSGKYPVIISNEWILVPNPDGVIDPGAGDASMTAEGVNVGVACSSSHTCERIYTLGAPGVRPHELIVVVGWHIELASDVNTDGRSLVLVSDLFDNHGHQIKSGPVGYDLDPPNCDVRADCNGGTGCDGGMGSDRVADGRNAADSGAVAVFAARIRGVKVDASGLEGEAGCQGRNGEGTFWKKGVAWSDFGEPYLWCEGSYGKDKYPTSGGNGGAGGSAGAILVRYPELSSADGLARDPALTREVLDENCVGDCANPLCALHPAVAACDMLREADNFKCTNAIDDDLDGLSDCQDPDCVGNPFVTACASDMAVQEVSVEACSDGLDNNGDGRVDCEDPDCALREVCGADPARHLPSRTGREEASDESCSNGVDDDLDGMVDCADYECQYHPRVSVCSKVCRRWPPGAPLTCVVTRERTVEHCVDGVDNDHDGLLDCEDPDCHNPYAIVCSGAPFLLESDDASCSDEIDNDNDTFTDCKDYQCLNSPRVSVCGAQENMSSTCSDGIDNDGDGKVDCQDSTCRYSPYFGDALCSGAVKSSHTLGVRLDSTFNGVGLDASVLLRTRRGAGGAGGQRGTELIFTESYTYTEMNCDPAQDICTRTRVLICRAEKAVGDGGSVPLGPLTDGAVGRGGEAASSSVRFATRRSIDTLRALLMPQQWLVRGAQANKLFRTAEPAGIENAAKMTQIDLTRMYGVLSEAGVSCNSSPEDVAASPHPYLSRRLVASLCPTIFRASSRLSNIVSGLNFFGEPSVMPVNPRERFADQYDSFQTRMGHLEHNVGKWIDLANGSVQDAHLRFDQQQLEATVKLMNGAIKIAGDKVGFAEVNLSNIDAKLNERKNVLASLSESVETNNAVIAAKYNAAAGAGGFGQLVLDLGTAFANVFLGKLGSEVAERSGMWLLESLETASEAERGGPAPPMPADGSSASTNLFNPLWESVQAAAKGAIRSDAVKKKASSAGAVALDELLHLGSSTGVPLGADAIAPRSIEVTQIANELLDSEQRQVALQFADLVLDRQKAVLELAIARQELAMLRATQVSTATSARLIADFSNYSTELRAYDRVLLGQNAYTAAISLVDELTYRYWSMRRQAEYEFLRFDGAGLNELSRTPDFWDFNLLNYSELATQASQLAEEMKSGFNRQPLTLKMQLPFSALQPATDSELAFLDTIGLRQIAPFDSLSVMHVALSNAEVSGNPLFAGRRNVRVSDVRVRFERDSHTPSSPDSVPAYVVRNRVDSFRVAKANGEDLLVDFEIGRNVSMWGTALPSLDFVGFAACDGNLSSEELGASCGLIAGSLHDPWIANRLYDRSLIGDWMIVVDGSGEPGPSQMDRIQVTFVTESEDLLPPPNPTPPACTPSQVVISQVYGAGGNTGAIFKNDFIELHNKSDRAVTMTNWSLQYASAAGSAWGSDSIPVSGTIESGGYYLISLAGGTNGVALPTPDISNTGVNMAAASGKVALVMGSAPLVGPCPTSADISDVVYYGSATGSDACTRQTANLSTTAAAIRSPGCGTSFALATPAPRHSGSTAVPCGCR